PERGAAPCPRGEGGADPHHAARLGAWLRNHPLTHLAPPHSGLSNFRTAVVGVSLRCAPGRAARAVGHDTTVANRAGPPPRTMFGALRAVRCAAAASRPSGRASLTHRGKSKEISGRMNPRQRRPEVRLRGLAHLRL